MQIKNILKRKKKPVIPTQLTPDEKIAQIERFALVLEKMRLKDYLETINKPWRLIWINFLAGIGKGVGLTIGATLIIALLFKLLSALISMNIPYLTGMLQEIVQIIHTTPGIEKLAPSDMPETPAE